jgi:hypothetical protein
MLLLIPYSEFISASHRIQCIYNTVKLGKNLFLIEMSNLGGPAGTKTRTTAASFAYCLVDHRYGLAFIKLNSAVGTKSNARLTAGANFRINPANG